MSSPVCQTSSGPGRMAAPAATKSASGIAEPVPASRSTNTSWPARTSSCTPAGVIATRYSWFLTSLGTPTFMTAALSRPPAGSVAGGPVLTPPTWLSDFACPGFPEPREPALTGGIRGQDTHRSHTIVQVARQECSYRPLQRQPAGSQVRLLVAEGETAIRLRNLGQATGQKHPQPLGEDPRRGEAVDEHMPTGGGVPGLLAQFPRRGHVQRLGGHVPQTRRNLPEQP